MRIPFVDTELENSTTRATQARKFEPDELYAHRTLSEDRDVSKFTPKLLGSKVSVQEPSNFVLGGVCGKKFQGFP